VVGPRIIARKPIIPQRSNGRLCALEITKR
jgi:hypothetical protein